MNLRRKIALWLCPELGAHEAITSRIAWQTLANARAANKAISRQVAGFGDIGSNYDSHGSAGSRNGLISPIGSK
ncbi:hypothetical protein ABIE32_004321 [Comamonas sp. 4034]